MEDEAKPNNLNRFALELDSSPPSRGVQEQAMRSSSGDSGGARRKPVLGGRNMQLKIEQPNGYLRRRPSKISTTTTSNNSNTNAVANTQRSKASPSQRVMLSKPTTTYLRQTNPFWSFSPQPRPPPPPPPMSRNKFEPLNHLFNRPIYDPVDVAAPGLPPPPPLPLPPPALATPLPTYKSHNNELYSVFISMFTAAVFLIFIMWRWIRIKSDLRQALREQNEIEREMRLNGASSSSSSASPPNSLTCVSSPTPRYDMNAFRFALSL